MFKLACYAVRQTKKNVKGAKKKERQGSEMFFFLPWDRPSKPPKRLPAPRRVPSDGVNDVTPFFHKHGEIKTVGGGFNVTNVLKQASSGLNPPCRSDVQLAGDV